MDQRPGGAGQGGRSRGRFFSVFLSHHQGLFKAESSSERLQLLRKRDVDPEMGMAAELEALLGYSVVVTFTAKSSVHSKQIEVGAPESRERISHLPISTAPRPAPAFMPPVVGDVQSQKGPFLSADPSQNK